MPLYFIASTDSISLFQVIQDGDRYELIHAVGVQSDSLSPCHLRPYCIKSLSVLFYALLYLKVCDTDISDSDRAEFTDFLEKIYFNGVLPPAESLRLLHSCTKYGDPMLSFVRCHKPDYILNDVYQELKDKLAQKNGVMPPLDTYDDWLSVCQQYKLHIPDRRYWAFNSGLELLSWLLDQVIDSGKPIRKCALCGHYFLPEHLDTIYCTKLCRREAEAKSRFCGCKDVERKYQEVYQAIRRKTNSNKQYRYFPLSFSESFSELELFEMFSFSTKKLYAHIFTKSDFLKIKETFFQKNKVYYQAFQQSSAAYRSGEISNAEFLHAKEQYLNWLTNVRIQIASFDA